MFAAVFHAASKDCFSAERPGRLSPLLIGIPSRSATMMPLFVAKERGFFRDEGFEAELILIKASDFRRFGCAFLW